VVPLSTATEISCLKPEISHQRVWKRGDQVPRVKYRLDEAHAARNVVVPLEGHRFWGGRPERGSLKDVSPEETKNRSKRNVRQQKGKP